MRIHDILTAKGFDVVVSEPNATVAELVSVLREHNLGAVVVSTDNGVTLTGIVSERDVIRHLADGPQVLDAPVSAIMSTDVHTCTPDDSVDSVMTTMTEQRIRHLPVVDGGHALRGIISIGDVVKSRIDQLQFECDQLTGYVSG